MAVEFDYIPAVKTVLVAAVLAISSVASQVEPSQSVWVMSLAGGLGGVAIGKDRSLKTMAIHAMVGVFIAVAASQIMVEFIHAPQPAMAGIVGLFAARAALWTACKIETEGLGWLLPAWFNRKGDGK